MGFFKDAKDGIMGAKELGEYHGGMPSIRGSFKDLAALSDDRGQGEILKVGTPARAIAKGFAMPSATEKFTMQIELEVHPPEGEPYTVTYLYPTARQKTALSAGMEVPVKIHPDDPMMIAVQWDALKGANAAAGGDMNAAMAGLQNTYAGTADAAGRAYLAGQEAAKQQASPPAAPQDPAERMKKVNQLFEAGLISAEEAEAKKSEILNDI
jgi:hypothetical protein